MRKVLVLLPLALTLSCSDLIPPERDQVYPWHLTADSKVFSIRWEQSLSPVRIWVEPGSPLAPHVATALSRWENALVYGELRTVLVSDSSRADVVVRNQPPGAMDPGDPGDPGEIRLQRRAPECSGETRLDIDPSRMRMTLPVNLYVWVNGAASGEALTTCYRLTTTHEFGHAFGILRHSPSSNDVMYYNPTLDGLSIADRETFETVFHSQPTVTIVPRQR